MISRVASLVAVVIATMASTGVAQDASNEAKVRYENALQRSRELVKECREISTRFFDGSLADSYQWKEKWDVAARKLADHRPELEQSAIDWFAKCIKPNQELIRVLGAVSVETYAAGDFETTFTILEKIEKFLPEEDMKLKRRLALAGIKCNRFDRAMELIQTQDGIDSINELESQLDKNMFLLTPMLFENWKLESELRLKEAKEDDLPRVKLQLGSDEIVIELFENEAPESVANFISLVESGYYDDAFFAPVIKGIVAQSGVYNRSTGSVPVGYVIKNESKRPDARKHFAGSVSMVSNGSKDSASTMFSITIVPNPDLDWDGSEEDQNCQAVFGRVISGVSLVNALPATMEIDEESQKQKPIKDVKPRIIDTATVIRKRDHEYKFERIKENAR